MVTGSPLLKKANLDFDAITHYGFQFAHEYDREYGNVGFGRSFLPEDELIRILQDKALNSIPNCTKDDAMRVAVVAAKILSTMGINLNRVAAPRITFKKVENPEAERERELAEEDEGSYDAPPGDIEIKMFLGRKHIGSVEYNVLHAAPEPTAQVAGSWIAEPYRGKGYGRQMYDELFRVAKADGIKTVVSDENLSEDGQGLWESLVRRGVAKQEGHNTYYVKFAVAEEFRQMNDPLSATDQQRDVGDEEKRTGEINPQNVIPLDEPDKNYHHPFGMGFGTEPESTRYGSSKWASPLLQTTVPEIVPKSKGNWKLYAFPTGVPRGQYSEIKRPLPPDAQMFFVGDKRDALSIANQNWGPLTPEQEDSLLTRGSLRLEDGIELVVTAMDLAKPVTLPKRGHEEMPFPDTGEYDEKSEDDRRRVAEVEANYAESGEMFDPKGDYLCKTCSQFDKKAACGTVEGKISGETGSCQWWQKGTPLVQIEKKFSQTEAGYTERPHEKGFGCHRCEYGAEARGPVHGSIDRPSWCGFWGMHVLPNACCSKNEGPDDVFAPSDNKAESNPEPKQAALESNIVAFMNDFKAGTWVNPLNPRERVLGEGAAIELRPFQGAIHLSLIRSFDKGEGQGSQALKFICDLADKHGVKIEGDAVPVGEGGLKQKNLIAWYKRYGFTFEGESFVREPRGSKQAARGNDQAIRFHDAPDFKPPRDYERSHIDENELDPEVRPGASEAKPAQKGVSMDHAPKLEGFPLSTGQVPLKKQRAERTVLTASRKTADDPDQDYWAELLEAKEDEAKKHFMASGDMQQIAQDNGWTMEQAWDELRRDFVEEFYADRNRMLASMDANRPAAEAYNQMESIQNQIEYLATSEHVRDMSDPLQDKLNTLRDSASEIVKDWDRLEGEQPARHAFAEPIRGDQE